MLEVNDTLNVLLSVVGESRSIDEDQPDVIRLVTTGTLSRESEDSYTLSYTETDPDENRSQDITLSLNKKRIVMTRSGPYETTLVFEKDKRFDGIYQTPWGGISMGVFPVRVRFDIGETEGRADLEYQVDMQGSFSSMHRLTIRFAPNG